MSTNKEHSGWTTYKRTWGFDTGRASLEGWGLVMETLKKVKMLIAKFTELLDALNNTNPFPKSSKGSNFQPANARRLYPLIMISIHVRRSGCFSASIRSSFTHQSADHLAYKRPHAVQYAQVR